MLINLQGYGHFQDGKNNQDFGFEEENMILIVDGCTECEYSESGGRMFAQLFKQLPEHDNPNKFEQNIKVTFNSIIKWAKGWFPKDEELENFIEDNYLFTILACFKQEDKFIVKLYGDGYIVTINNKNMLSFIRLNYGKRPPYYAYNYCSKDTRDIYKNYNFREFVFPSKDFKNVGIATDGLQPIAKGFVSTFENIILKDGTQNQAKVAIEQNHYMFSDDVTFGIFNNGGK